jgi:hypothetical protein
MRYEGLHARWVVFADANALGNSVRRGSTPQDAADVSADARQARVNVSQIP